MHKGDEKVEGPLHEVDVLRRQDPIQPISEGVASTLNGGAGIVGGAVGTVETTTGGVAGTAENTVANGLARTYSISWILITLLTPPRRQASIRQPSRHHAADRY
jgi:hypothetical protein